MIERQLAALVSTAYVFAAYVLWRFLGIDACGNVLIAALSYQNETPRTVAAILLVKSPHRARPLLQRAIADRVSLVQALRISGEVADEALEATIRSYIADPDPQVSKDAHDALRIIADRRFHSKPRGETSY